MTTPSSSSQQKALAWLSSKDRAFTPISLGRAIDEAVDEALRPLQRIACAARDWTARTEAWMREEGLTEERLPELLDDTELELWRACKEGK